MTRPPVPPTIAVGAEKPITVLVVDDDARVRIAIGQTIAFEADMLLVGEAANAAAALALAADLHPSVALVDVLLPYERTGLSLVRSLRQQAGCAVVAMSVRSAIGDAALAAGATAFIEKGRDIDALLHSIRTAAQSSL